MDKRRQALEAQQAELHMALLMDEYAAELGKHAREDADEAYANGEFTVPPELDATVLSMIENAPEPGRKRKPVKAVLRYALAAALTAALLFGTLIAVQAAGVDVFGSIASWTDSVFHFRSENETNEAETIEAAPENQIQEALRELDMPIELAPTWFPDGVETIHVTKYQVESTKAVSAYVEVIDSQRIQVLIEENEEQAANGDFQWEKEDTSAIQYTINNKSFFLMKNESAWTGVWSDGKYTVSIFGVASQNNLEKIINSIGDTNE